MKPAAGRRPRVLVVGVGSAGGIGGVGIGIGIGIGIGVGGIVAAKLCAHVKRLEYAARERHSSTIEETRP